VLVPFLLSLDTFPYVKVANLVLLKLYSLVPHPQKDQFLTDVCTVFVIVFPFRPTLVLHSQSVLLSPLSFLFEPRPRFMLYNFPHYFLV
jgi:hypothetical protein